jgi:hypothetical protein
MKKALLASCALVIAIASPAAIAQQISRDQFISLAEQGCLVDPQVSFYMPDLARMGVSRNDLCRCVSTTGAGMLSENQLAQMDLQRKPTPAQKALLLEQSTVAVALCLGRLTAR